MTLGINGEDTLISISDKDFNEVLVDKYILKYTGENGIVLDMFERTAKEISDAKFEVLKKLLGKDVPIELQTDSYFNYILKIFGFRNSTINDEISILLDFATKLLNNSTPLDGDIAKLVNDNIMDLLAVI